MRNGENSSFATLIRRAGQVPLRLHLRRTHPLRHARGDDLLSQVDPLTSTLIIPAERYDTQVEVLLNGTANAMRRQAIPALYEAFAGRDQRTLCLFDVSCGTGRFLDFVKQAWPRLHTIGLDMSDAYARHAKRRMARRSRMGFIVGKAEAIPLSQDAVTSIFLFHELPPRIRRIALREFTRVLKPGGRLVILDSLQRGDRPDYDRVLELFPRNYHEPYYSSYMREDFITLASTSDLTYVRSDTAFVSKVMVFNKSKGS